MSRRLLTASIAGLFVLAWSAPAMALQAAPAQRPAPQAPAKKAKKVWTNEDLEAMRPGGAPASSSAASAAASTAPSTAGEAAAADESAEKAGAQKQEGDSPVEKLRKRLAAIRTDLDSVEAQLRSFRQVRSSGNTTAGGIDVNKIPGGVNTEDQIAQLERRRANLLRQIADVEDEARRASISPGAIR